jgi:hypothetical protein
VSDPRRLSSSAGDEDVRELLRHGRVGAPPGFKERALDVAVQTLAAPAAAAGAGVAGKGIGAAASKVALLTNVHWIGIACVVGVCTAGGVIVSRTASEVPKSSAAVRLVPTAKGRAAPQAGSDWSPVAVDLMSLPAAPSATSALSSSAPPSSPPISLAPIASAQVEPPASATNGDDLADLNLSPELVPLDLARRAIADREQARALDILDDYDRRFPEGALRSEATMLRIEALVAAGRRPDAARLGAAVLASAPDSPYAARVRSLIGSGETK